ncbi:Golgi apparatus protein 1-like, partial [Pseudochaenichthys georgianus]|uniref:Golgi apparatus protein 1-like n=1 Tax=Pseudochaenichthys georgianus TaxID=52239 RepID=UPI00146AA673
MADCIRVPLLLLLLCIISSLHPIQCQNNPVLVKVPANPETECPSAPRDSSGEAPDTGEDPRGGPRCLENTPLPAGKLSEEEVCQEDLARLCPNTPGTNNLAVLECLQDKKEETEIAAECNHLLWNYKLNLTTDPKFESVAVEVCKTTITEIKECASEQLGKGFLVSCLVDHRGNITDYQCNQYITKMTTIVFSDYRLICGFMDKCREDINTLHCGSISTGDKDVHSQGEVIACLEKGLVREAEEQPGAHPIKEECKKSIMRVAELSSDDFHLDRYLYFSCRDDRERFCEK